MHMLFFSLILLTTMMNAFVSHELVCWWFSVFVCVCFTNGAALTMKMNFYNLAETTFLHICKCFVFFQSFLSSYTLRFKYFSFQQCWLCLLDL